MLEGVVGSLGTPSATYRVRASEIAQNQALAVIRVQVRFLDDSTQVFELEKRAKGQTLLNLVYVHLDLIEKDYFSLQLPELVGNAEILGWLDPLKTVKKQLGLKTKTIGSLGLPQLFFRVKFWVTDPGKLSEEYTRYLFVLQLRKNILEEEMSVTMPTAALLSSYIVQSDLGDFDENIHGQHYLAEYTLVPNQTCDIEKKISELHKLHSGQSSSDAEFNYLDHAKRLDHYGVDIHCAKDSTNRDLHIGVTSSGLVVIRNRVKMNTFSWAKIMKVSFKRKQFFIQLHREVPENYDSVLGFNLSCYKSCKALWKSCVEHHTFFRLHTPRPPTRRPVLTLGSKFRYSGRTEFQTVEECKKKPIKERSFVRSPSKQFASSPSVPSLIDSATKKQLSSSSFRSRADSSTYKVTSLPGATTPKMAWVDDKDSNGDLNGHNGELCSITAITSSTSSTTSSQIDAPISSLLSLQSGSTLDDISQGLVTIRMRPDDSGKFGFNVKGGCDQNQAVLVSRVTPGMSAHRCYPRLNEGDQVLYINGKDVALLNHEEVVHLIRSTRDSTESLVLTVKQNVYEPEGLEEPAFQYVPETTPTGSLSGKGGALDESILLLSEALESGSLLDRFEQLYRRKQGFSVSEAKKIENECKNRYRDISPYDITRVILRTTSENDYINGSHVNMEIPGSGVVNRYIACQGPLSGTCLDFWCMVWEQQSTLIVMLTTVVEQGRVKCYRYWPKVNESVEYGKLKVSCVKEEETPGFAFREFTLTNLQSEEAPRYVTHMQYQAWPDHGVPDDSTDFLQYVGRVREARIGMVEPTIVHCSAGIGRTGVLILMETAQCLIEANQPVYPLDIVRTMRDQRAMMIQTVGQYKFVCEAIQRVYKEGLVVPLLEYQHR